MYNYLLQVMHRWQKGNDSCIEKKIGEQCCIAHKLMHIQHKKIKSCNCGKNDPIHTPDELYSESIDVEQLLLDLDRLGLAKKFKVGLQTVVTKYTKAETRTIMYDELYPEKIFEGFGVQLKEMKYNECIFEETESHCNSTTFNTLGRVSGLYGGFTVPMSPEVLTFNLNWGKSRTTRDLAKVFFSISNDCLLSELFSENEGSIKHYYIRGIVCSK